MAHCMLQHAVRHIVICGLRLQVHTLRLCNTHCFSTATMVPRTRLNVAFYVLSCSSTIWPPICSKETDIGNSYSIRQETKTQKTVYDCFAKVPTLNHKYAWSVCIATTFYRQRIVTVHPFSSHMTFITNCFSSLSHLNSQSKWIRICSQHTRMFVTSSKVITKLKLDKSYYTRNATYFNYVTF